MREDVFRLSGMHNEKTMLAKMKKSSAELALKERLPADFAEALQEEEAQERPVQRRKRNRQERGLEKPRTEEERKKQWGTTRDAWAKVLKKRKALRNTHSKKEEDYYKKCVTNDRELTRSRMLKGILKRESFADGNDTDLPPAKRSRLSQDLEFWGAAALLST